MSRAWVNRVAVGLQILCGVLMALGALGHSAANGLRIQSDLADSRLSLDQQHLLIVVWHFGGVCMVLLGGLVAFAARMPGLQPAAIATGLTYTAFGLVAWAWSGMPFFAVFTVLGLGALGAIRLGWWQAHRGGNDKQEVQP